MKAWSPLDRGALLGVRPDVHDLGGAPFAPALEAQSIQRPRNCPSCAGLRPARRSQPLLEVLSCRRGCRRGSGRGHCFLPAANAGDSYGLRRERVKASRGARLLQGRRHLVAVLFDVARHHQRSTICLMVHVAPRLVPIPGGRTADRRARAGGVPTAPGGSPGGSTARRPAGFGRGRRSGAADQIARVAAEGNRIAVAARMRSISPSQ